MLAKNKVINKQYGKNNNRLKRGQIYIRQVLFLENDVHVYIQIDVLQKSKKLHCIKIKIVHIRNYMRRGVQNYDEHTCMYKILICCKSDGDLS